MHLAYFGSFSTCGRQYGLVPPNSTGTTLRPMERKEKKERTERKERKERKACVSHCTHTHEHTHTHTHSYITHHAV